MPNASVPINDLEPGCLKEIRISVSGDDTILYSQFPQHFLERFPEDRYFFLAGVKYRLGIYIDIVMGKDILHTLSRIYSLPIYLFFKELIHILPVCNNVHRPVKPFLQLILYPNKHEKVWL